MNNEMQELINNNMQMAGIKLSNMLNDFSNECGDNYNCEDLEIGTGDLPLNNNLNQTDYANVDIEDEEYEKFKKTDEFQNLNINDYILAEEENEFGNMTNIINIFACYFKQIFEKKQDATIFDGLDYEKMDTTTNKCLSTNKCLEFMYEEIFKFNKSTENDKDTLYGPDNDSIDINNCDELYTLYIEEEPKYICKYVLPILQHLSTLKWTEFDWTILKIKD